MKILPFTRKLPDVVSNNANNDSMFVKYLLQKYGNEKLSKNAIKEITSDILEYNGLPRKALKLKFSDFSAEKRMAPVVINAQYYWGTIKVNRYFLNMRAADIIPTIEHEVIHSLNSLKLAKDLGVDRFCDIAKIKKKKFFKHNIKYVNSNDVNMKSLLEDVKLESKIDSDTSDGMYNQLWYDYYYATSYDEKLAYQAQRKFSDILNQSFNFDFFSHLKKRFPAVQRDIVDLVKRDGFDKSFLHDALFNSLWRNVELNNPIMQLLYSYAINTHSLSLSEHQIYQSNMLKLCADEISKNSSNSNFVNENLIKWFNFKRKENTIDKKFLKDYIDYMDFHNRTNQSLKAVLHIICNQKPNPRTRSMLYKNRLFQNIVERTGMNNKILANKLIKNYFRNKY